MDKIILVNKKGNWVRKKFRDLKAGDIFKSVTLARSWQRRYSNMILAAKIALLGAGAFFMWVGGVSMEEGRRTGTQVIFFCAGSLFISLGAFL